MYLVFVKTIFTIGQLTNKQSKQNDLEQFHINLLIDY